MKRLLLIIWLRLVDIGLEVKYFHVDVLTRLGKISPFRRWKTVKFITEVELLHESATEYLKNFPNGAYAVSYNFICPDSIEKLRADGWTITVEPDVHGNLYYVFHGNKVNA